MTMARKTKFEKAMDEARDMGKRGATPHNAFDVAEAWFGIGTKPKGSPERRAFIGAYNEAFAAAGWEWKITDWNARRNASGMVRRRQAPAIHG
jgi:hypothetical protein